MRAGLFDDENHLAARVAKGVLGHSNFSLRVNSSIPLSRGLGSSAALAVAAAAAAGPWTRWPSPPTWTGTRRTPPPRSMED